MKLLLWFLLAACAVPIVYAESEKCYNDIKECDSTNYEEYLNCITKRKKRSIECDSPCDSDNCIDTCGDCDCDSCNSSCNNNRNSCCGSCCASSSSCRTNHCCHKTCHATCKTNSCRSSCRRTCKDTVEKIIACNNSTTNNTTTNSNNQNITTVIHINNVVNTTNIIDVPVSVNSAFSHNMSIINTDNRQNSTGKCCTVIGPRQCASYTEFPFVRCSHHSSKQCGNFCSADIVHKERRQVCRSMYQGIVPNCLQKIIYIPQPQPRCSYRSNWPYVSCGIERSTSCAGCYGHYVDQENKNYMNCPSGCYDDGFGVGPYYRLGPFYRPNYMHVPCHPNLGYGYIGAYGEMPFGFGGFGGFGGYGAMSGMGGMGGYVPFVVSGVDGIEDPTVPYGSWSPGDVNGFGLENETNITSEFNSSNADEPVDTLINVGPGFSNPLGFLNPFKSAREVKSQRNYEPPSAVQGEMKFKSIQTERGEETKGASTNTIVSTTTTKVLPKGLRPITKKPIVKKLA